AGGPPWRRPGAICERGAQLEPGRQPEPAPKRLPPGALRRREAALDGRAVEPAVAHRRSVEDAASERGPQGAEPPIVGHSEWQLRAPPLDGRRQEALHRAAEDDLPPAA